MVTFMTPGQPVETTGKNLAGLWRPSFVKVDQRLYVFGGGGVVTDDLHYLDLKNMRWESVKNTYGTPPSKRYGHSATRWKDSIIIFGGCNEYQEYCEDVHIFNLKTSTWHQPNITGTVVSRYLHTANVYDDKLIIFGGFAKSSDCTYVLDELCVLDLKSMVWTRYHDMPPRYNHSATLVGNKMYIYAGKDEQGNTVSDLYMINLSKSPYTPHLVLSGQHPSQSTQLQPPQSNQRMILIKSQHFCDTACGKLLVFGRYLNYKASDAQAESAYSLWMLDLDTLEWDKQECEGLFEQGGWNYFTITNDSPSSAQININNLLFLGNTDPYRPQGYDHFRDALVIPGEALGLYDISQPRFSSEFVQLLNNPELSDFSIFTGDGQEIFVHQVILLTRWPHFKNMLKSGMSEMVARKMSLPESFNVVMAFLKFLYSDRLDDNEPWQVICDLLVMANMYLVHRLKKLCCERLYKRHMAIESCGLIFEKAIMAEETGLKLLTLSFMFQNYGFILKSNMLMDLPTMVRDEFLEAVPDDAILEVGKTKFLTSSTQQPNASILDNNYNQTSLLNYIASDATTNELIPINNSSNNTTDMTIEV